MRAPIITAIVFLLAALFFRVRDVYALLAFTLAGFALATNVEEFVIPMRARMKTHGETWLTALGRVITSNRPRYGGYLAHLGVLTAVAGIAASSTLKMEREITLKLGESVTVAGQTIRLDEVWGLEEKGRTSIGADVTLLRGGRVIDHLEPEQHFFAMSDQPIPTPAVRSTIARDVYVNLMAFKQDGSSATVRVLVEPLVVWIWAGGGIVCLGALFGLWPRRRPAPAPAVAHTRAQSPKRAARTRRPAEALP
jgi:cytochrome c-type biogenesis protein CcmF